MSRTGGEHDSRGGQRGRMNRLELIESFPGTVSGPQALRWELSHRAQAFAKQNGYLCEHSDGQIPSVIFGVDEAGRHGNFQPEAYKEIGLRPAWSKRLSKVHTASKRQMLRSNWRWRELDCANSSDALLMNIFCYPGVVSGQQTSRLLGIDAECKPEFGFKPRTPLLSGRFDATEIDLKIDDVLIEAKLTESDFQLCDLSKIERYRDFDEVFELSELPLVRGRQASYQLIRGTLAAKALGSRFCVLCDARRPDLLEAWYRVLRGVRHSELRSRLMILTWQELTLTLPLRLQSFLRVKYGIVGSETHSF